MELRKLRSGDLTPATVCSIRRQIFSICKINISEMALENYFQSAMERGLTWGDFLNGVYGLVKARTDN